MDCQIFKDQKKNISVKQDEILYLVDYHPKYRGFNPKHNNFDKLILRLKERDEASILFFTDRMNHILSSKAEYAICVMPSSSKGVTPSGIRSVAENLCTKSRINATEVIVRNFDIPKKSFGGTRNLKSEIESLSITDERLIKGEQVLLLDDITTSGTSLHAGKYKLEEVGADIIAMFALGKSRYYSII